MLLDSPAEGTFSPPVNMPNADDGGSFAATDPTKVGWGDETTSESDINSHKEPEAKEPEAKVQKLESMVKDAMIKLERLDYISQQVHVLQKNACVPNELGLDTQRLVRHEEH